MVYLIHFKEPYKHAKHYLGYAKNLDERIERHIKNQGARLLQVLNDCGIEWAVVRTWKGGRELERKLKNRKNSPKLCPICRRKYEQNKIAKEIKDNRV